MEDWNRFMQEARAGNFGATQSLDIRSLSCSAGNR